MFRRIPRATTWVVLAIALFGMVHTAHSQGCFDHVLDRFYTPTDCSATPYIDRTFRMQTISWKGNDYLFVDEGNEIVVLNINNPKSPLEVSTSTFNVPNVGDSDYDLMNFSVCDGCRYGIANYKAGTVLFDLGTGPVPDFGGHSVNSAATIVKGGYTFMVGDQQYLVAATLGSSPCPMNTSGLYAFNGIDELDNPRVQCLDNGVYGPQIANGLRVDGTNPPVFYMAELFDNFRIYRWNASNQELDYLGNSGIERANMFRGYGAGVDTDAGLLAVAKSGVLSIYDIGYGVGSPTAPVLLSQLDLLGLDGANAVAIDFPIVHVSQQYSFTEPQTFDVSTPTNPAPLDHDFWDPSHGWNSFSACVKNNQALFSDDGTAMYLSRYSSLQIIDPTACPGPLFEDGFETGDLSRWSATWP